MRYSIEPKDRIYVKGYGLLSFAKNMDTQLSSKYGQKLFDSVKKLTTHVIKAASKRAVQKTAETTGDLIGNRVADKITSVSKTFPEKLRSQNNEDNDESEAPKKRYISPEKDNKLLMN